MQLKDVEGFEGLYKVSPDGEVYSYAKIKGHHKGKILKPQNGSYYLVVNLHKNGVQKQYFIHKLVALAYIDNPLEYTIVNHIDGNKLNNKVTNLEWCNQSMNQQHAVDTGLWVVTDKHRESASKQGKLARKLSFKQVQEIKELLKKEKKQGDIALLYGVSRGTIRNIRDGVTYEEYVHV